MSSFEVERVGGELRRFGAASEPARFEVVSPFEPSGDQPQAIASLVEGVERGDRYQVLLGVTGSGKTYTMAKTIEALGKPTLVMAPNKTLAAQLASELKEFFPHNAVVYFVSYYDYYQPEAYVPQSDTYIEKDASINEEVEMLRHQATSQLLSRNDVIVVASVSCIYGIGSPEDYAGLAPNVDKREPLERDDFIHALIDIQYDRNDFDLARGTFRVRGDSTCFLRMRSIRQPHCRDRRSYRRDSARVRRYSRVARFALRDGEAQGGRCGEIDRNRDGASRRRAQGGR